ncbi:MAG TPA: formate dehydrogenase accessory sulfurtransferase FdhD [Bradyrhizobium sp.]|nr:formate dehydrogenase accessory sulfurtransferase FdhD [Bradyrhizobium sp.]
MGTCAPISLDQAAQAEHRTCATPPSRNVCREIWRDGLHSGGERPIPEETPVALVYDGSTYAVMMATPEDLEDFAIGFSLTEGVVRSATDIKSIDLVRSRDGIELRMWLAGSNSLRLRERRRRIAGPTGCGLCGIESLAESIRPPEIVGEGRRFASGQIIEAIQSILPLQRLNIETRAVHAAAFWQSAHGVVALREDVGRHNALDKLAGALSRDAVTGHDGIVVLTSRVSVEMVQKTSVIGASVIVSVSAPTALAVRVANDAGITLAAIARADGFEVFTRGDRIF